MFVPDLFLLVVLNIEFLNLIKNPSEPSIQKELFKKKNKKKPKLRNLERFDETGFQKTTVELFISRRIIKIEREKP